MKNILFLILSIFSINIFSQETTGFRLGVQWGFQGNRSYYSGGMETANARFQHNSFGGSALMINARYDLNQHWMLQSGLGFNTFGFDFALSENYSLLHQENRFSSIKSEFAALEIPLMGFYKFNPNCKNKKWLIGLGLVHSFIGAQSIAKNYSEAQDGSSNSNYLRSESKTKEGHSMALRFAIARERVFKRGSILNASLLFNTGFNRIAKASVVYTIDSKEYTHQFSNKGNFVGFRLTYYFKSFRKVLN